MKDYDQKQARLVYLRGELRNCAASGFGCTICDRSRTEIRELELEIGTVHPDHRARSSGALAR